MKMRSIILLLLSVSLFACVAPAPPPVVRDPAVLRRQMEALPGAAVGPDETLRVSYPGEVLFAQGAALPLPGGTAVLDPLAALLVSHSEARGRVTVRARTEISAEYDRSLAQKRAELLERYFRNRGIPEGRLSFTTEAGDGPPLELTLETPGDQPPSASSSSPEK